MAERTYPSGVPCWIDIEPPDADAAQEFYTGLFGWTFSNAMPPDAPGSLKDNEVYGLVAYLLALNELIPADAVIDATSLANVKMPAHDHFVPDTRGEAKPAPRSPRR